MALSRRSPAEAPVLFDVDPEPAQDLITGFAGLTLGMETFRGLKRGESANRHVEIKERQRGFDEGTYGESLVLLNAAGGDCLEDFDQLRQDRALEQLIGHARPSPEAARKFLYAFHDPGKIEQAQQQRAPEATSYIPEESEPLRALARVGEETAGVAARESRIDRSDSRRDEERTGGGSSAVRALRGPCRVVSHGRHRA
jgi:hypothetical protein